MHLSDDQIAAEVKNITTWIVETFRQNQKSQAVIAVSGGVDSGLALTLLTQALGTDCVWPVLLPMAGQDMTDALSVVEWNRIPTRHVTTLDIAPVVSSLSEVVGLTDKTRLGNIQARVRMILVFDLAKKLDALVCGTENKSENLLGYYTRYGDSASDLEPIAHLYKTQVYQLAKFLHLPDKILTKPPSAGLWSGQTDESEFGFSYQQADQVLWASQTNQSGSDSDVSSDIAQKVLARVSSQKFKAQVPYKIE